MVARPSPSRRVGRADLGGLLGDEPADRLGRAGGERLAGPGVAAPAGPRVAGHFRLARTLRERVRSGERLLSLWGRRVRLASPAHPGRRRAPQRPAADVRHAAERAGLGREAGRHQPSDDDHEPVHVAAAAHTHRPGRLRVRPRGPGGGRPGPGDPVAGSARNGPGRSASASGSGRPSGVAGIQAQPLLPLALHRLPDENDVGLPPKPNDPVLPRWVRVDGMGGFVAQILEVMQNWRDTLQSEIPGFRDRVYEARLDKWAGEGGLNLGMDVETVRRLQARGDRVGAAIVGGFDWDQHFFTRFVVTMQELELGLLGAEAPREPGGVQAAFSLRRDRFSAGDLGARELFGRDATWIRAAGDATRDLVAAANRWADFGRFVGDAPRPRPVMRIIPDV